jgi:hypothetical protein
MITFTTKYYTKYFFYHAHVLKFQKVYLVLSESLKSKQQASNTYKKLDKDPTKTTISHINKKLKSLKDQQKLDNNTYLKIRPSDSTTARFYRLPKIHKLNIPLRPFVYLPGSLYLPFSIFVRFNILLHTDLQKN